MDSDSIGDRLKKIQISKRDDMENVKEPVKDEVPKILNPEVRDVFHIFANMLDVKSFMKLAMTSKDMYKQCMEDKKIKIGIDEKSITFSSASVKFDIYSSNFSRRHNDGYVAALQKLPCMVNLGVLEIYDAVEPGVSMESKTHKFLKEIGVYRIHELTLSHDARDWVTVFAIIKEFNVEVVSIDFKIREDILRSILQLNLEKLSYDSKVTVPFILDINSPIREIDFGYVNRISKAKLMEILSKIQSGSLHRLIINSKAVNFDDFDALSFYHEGPLPEKRPLLFFRATYDDCYDSDGGGIDFENPLYEYWFLHRDGGVTNCAPDEYFRLEISKCDPWEYPYILRKEEDILNDLKEKHPKVSCFAEQFNTFFASLTKVDRCHQGSLPDDRPLYFNTYKKNFWLLDVEDKLMHCSWDDGFAKWSTPKSLSTMGIASFQHPVLAQYMFWKALEQVKPSKGFKFYSVGKEEFDGWFVNFDSLPFEYLGPLPSARPVVFKRPSSDSNGSCIRVLLVDDRLLQCEHRDRDVYIGNCHYLNRPPMFFKAKNVLEMLQDQTDRSVNLNVQYVEFLDGLIQFKRSSLVLQKRILITELLADEFWYWMEDVKCVRKVAWKEGRLSLVEGDLCESPSDFMKQIFKYHADVEDRCRSLKMEFEEFNSCLEQFSPVPFEYSGPLKSDSSLAFVKKEIRHMCDEVLRYPKSSSKEVRCQCSEVSSVLVWFVWDGKKVKKCSWGEKKPNEVRFNTNFAGMPPAFKSKEYLKFLLQEKYDKSTRLEWFGNAKDFPAYLEDCMKLPFNYDGPLPDERPLLFEKEKKHSTKQFLLRSDGTVIKCSIHDSSVELSLLSSRNYDAPRALKNII